MCYPEFVKAFVHVSVLLDRNNIYYIKYIFEGYDGLAQVTTQDKNMALVKIIFHNSQQELLTGILKALLEEGIIKEVLEL